MWCMFVLLLLLVLLQVGFGPPFCWQLPAASGSGSPAG